MGSKVFFGLEQIPSRYGTGYKAKMKRREMRRAQKLIEQNAFWAVLQLWKGTPAVGEEVADMPQLASFAVSLCAS